MKKPLISIISIFFCSLLVSEMISLEKAKKIALQNNPEYLAKRYAYDSAKWNEINAFSGLLPKLDLEGSQRQTKGTVNFGVPMDIGEMNTRLVGYSINQPLFMGGRIWLGYRISRDSKQMAEFALSEQKLNTISQVEEKYFSLLEAAEFLEISKDHLRSAENNQQIAETRFNLGTLSYVDLLKVQSDKAAKETELLQSEMMYALNYSGLKNFLQYQEDFEVENIKIEIYKYLIDELNSIEQKQIYALNKNFSAIILNKNYTIKTIKESKNIAHKNVLVAAGNFLPTLNLNYSQTWSKNWNQEQDASDVDYDDSKELMLSASFPIFPFADNFASYKKAKYDKRKTEQDFISIEDGIKLALESAILTLISSAKQVKASELTLDFTTELHSQMEERFSSGLVSSTEMLDSEVMLKGARISNIQSYFSFLQVKAELMQLLGIEDEEEFLKLINHEESE